MIDLTQSNITPVMGDGNRAPRDCPKRSVGRPFTLSKGTFNNTYEKLSSYEMVTEMVKIYPNMTKFYTFKNPFKKTRDGFETPVKLTNTNNKATTQAEKDENKARSIRRTRKMIMDIVACNDFDMYATWTFDPKKHPRCNEREYATKKMTVWLANQQRKYGHFDYILVAELQKSGNYHFHALLGGFTGKYHQIRTFKMKGKTLNAYKIDSWEKNNGFADMSDVYDKNAIGSYVAKYITKDLNEIDENKRRYWSSKNLKKPIVRYNETSENTGIRHLDFTNSNTFENEFCQIITIPHKLNKTPSPL